MLTTSSPAEPTTTPSRRSRWRTGLGATAIAAVAVGGLTLGAGSAAAATTLVLPADIAGACPQAQLCQEVRGTGTAAITKAPGAGDVGGPGALQLSTPTSSDKAAVRDYSYANAPLSGINTLSYLSTVLDAQSSNSDGAPALNIEVDTNGAAAGGYATLVWEPIYTGSKVTPNVQQTYNPSATPSGSGGWWASNSVTPTGTPNKYGFNTYTASFADVKAALPDATIYSIGINQGSGSPALRSAVDLLTANSKVLNFEQTAPVPAGQADLSVGVTAPPFSGAGKSIPVTVTVTNNGPGISAAATATVVTPGYLISGASAGGTVKTDGTTTFPVPVLTSGQSVTFSVTATPSSAFQVGLGVAYVFPAGQDPNLFNNIGLAPIVTR